MAIAASWTISAMLLLCILSAATAKKVLYSPATIGITTATASSVSSATPSESKVDAHHDLKLRAECPVPCGWKDWLCCAANEICYTAPNLEAACSPTAMPSVNVDITITVPFVTVTSVVKSTKIKTKTLTFSGAAHESDRTSVVTMTSIATSTVLYSSPFSKPTPTAAPKITSSTADPTARKQTGMSVTEQATIGASVSGAAIIAIVAAIFFCRRRRQKQQQQSQDPPNGDDPPRNFARIRDNRRSEVVSYEDIAPSLLPLQPVIRNGSDNPYRQDLDVPAPPYAPRSPPPAQHRPVVGGGQQRYNGPPMRSSGMPPRRPVRGMQPRVDDGTEY